MPEQEDVFPAHPYSGQHRPIPIALLVQVWFAPLVQEDHV